MKAEMKGFRKLARALATAGVGIVGCIAPAHAGIVLSQVVVDFQPGEASSQDIEVWNNGSERAYVAAEPAEIQSPGLSNERRAPAPDPTASGLLVTPQRMILEPDQRKLIRISTVIPRSDKERVYRVAIKPVAGPATSDASAVKVLVGYDVLVLFRASATVGDIVASRSGKRIIFENKSNTAQEMYDGKQCDTVGQNCVALGANRLYPGATWEQPLTYDTPVEYRLNSGTVNRVKQF